MLQPCRNSHYHLLQLQLLCYVVADCFNSLRFLPLQFAAAVTRSEQAAAASGDLDRDPYYLEIACEPQNIMSAAVAVDDLLLPPHFEPSNCSVGRFIKSYRCSLLQKAAGDESEQAVVSTRGDKLADLTAVYHCYAYGSCGSIYVRMFCHKANTKCNICMKNCRKYCLVPGKHTLRT